MSRVRARPPMPPRPRDYHHDREVWLILLLHSNGRRTYDSRIFTDDNAAGLRTVVQDYRRRGRACLVMLGAPSLAGRTFGAPSARGPHVS